MAVREGVRELFRAAGVCHHLLARSVFAQLIAEAYRQKLNIPGYIRVDIAVQECYRVVFRGSNFRRLYMPQRTNAR